MTKLTAESLLPPNYNYVELGAGSYGVKVKYQSRLKS